MCIKHKGYINCVWSGSLFWAFPFFIFCLNQGNLRWIFPAAPFAISHNRQHTHAHRTCQQVFTWDSNGGFGCRPEMTCSACSWFYVTGPKRLLNSLCFCFLHDNRTLEAPLQHRSISSQLQRQRRGIWGTDVFTEKQRGNGHIGMTSSIWKKHKGS